MKYKEFKQTLHQKKNHRVWVSGDRKVSFLYVTSFGWEWDVYNWEIFSDKERKAFRKMVLAKNIQISGFKTRKAAAKYAASILETLFSVNVDKTSFQILTSIKHQRVESDRLVIFVNLIKKGWMIQTRGLPNKEDHYTVKYLDPKTNTWWTKPNNIEKSKTLNDAIEAYLKSA